MPSFRGRLWFCSNFFPMHVEYKGLRFPSAEHAYCWEKVADAHDKANILLCAKPGEAKRYARGVPMRPDWDAVKIDTMREILRAKFRQPMCRRLLLETGEETLVEENEWGDTFWGTCKGVGENWLGRLLMDIRQELWGDGEEE